MNILRKYEIALIVYRTMLRENGIRFFPKKTEKEVARIVKLASHRTISSYEVCCFLAEEYARIIYGELHIARNVTGATLLSENIAGPIAVACLIDRAREHGIQLDTEDFKKQIGNAHKLTKIPKEELREFYVEIICDFFQSLKA